MVQGLGSHAKHARAARGCELKRKLAKFTVQTLRHKQAVLSAKPEA